MRIVCPNCSTSYDLPEASVGPGGKRVRCAACQTVWRVLDEGSTAPERKDHEQTQLARAGATPFPEATTMPPVVKGSADDLSAWGLDPDATDDTNSYSNSNDADMAAAMSMAGSDADDTDFDQSGVDSLFDDIPSAPRTSAALAEAANANSASSDGVGAFVMSPPTASGAGRSSTAADLAAMEQALLADSPLLESLPALASNAADATLINQAIAAAKPAVARGRVALPVAARNSRVPTAAILCVLVLGGMMSAIAFRDTVVSRLPQLARLYEAAGLKVNLRGLEIVNIRSQLTKLDDASVLVIEGEIVNPSREAKAVPSLYLAVLDSTGNETYAWTAPLDKASLEPGESLPFRRRLAAPPADGRKVLVRFQREGDPVAAPNPAKQLP